MQSKDMFHDAVFCDLRVALKTFQPIPTKPKGIAALKFRWIEGFVCAEFDGVMGRLTRINLWREETFFFVKIL